MTAAAMDGRFVLIVEDHYHIAMDVETTLEEAGARVVGPVATVPAALDIIARTEHLDAAILDINLRGSTSYEIADVLRARGVPVVFVTGYDRSVVPERYVDIPVSGKPFDLARCSALLFA